MATPKKKPKKMGSEKTKFDKAADFAKGITKRKEKNVDSQGISNTSLKKLGRPPSRPGVDLKRTTIGFSQEIDERISIAVIKEKSRRNDLVDKSSLIEEIVTKWLDDNKY
jgi:hypothetical protein